MPPKGAAVPALPEGARGDRILILGSVLRDRTGAQWVVQRITKSFAWVHTHPTPPNEDAIPFSWAVVNGLEVVAHASQHSPKGPTA